VKRQRPVRHALPLALLALALAGCASSPEERFYTLAATASAPARVGTAAAGYSVAVGPVTIPAIVDRPQMVLRTGANRVLLAEQSRWAEPLKDSIPRAIAGNLAQLLDDGQVSAYHQGLSSEADYQVEIDVQRFESAQGDAATIDVLWAVRAEGRTRKAGRSLVREPAGGTSIDALVAAHGRALLAVSRDIAVAIREAAASPPRHPSAATSKQTPQD
jgi:uncharacterized lipoprotein YmbA